MPQTFVLYHGGGCRDGYGAAWAAACRFGADGAQYIACNYGNPIPEIPDGSDVYIVDFSYPRQQLEALAQRCRLTVLDHHKTAEEDLRGLPFCRFDMKQSGAVLTWKHFFPEQPVPLLLQYVQDRDLWTWALPDSEAINALVDTLPQDDFGAWTRMSDRLDTEFDAVLAEARCVLRYIQKSVEEICRQQTVVTIAGQTVPACCTTILQSEVCHRLLELNPSAPFSACWAGSGQKIKWSLRGRPGGQDVSEVAKQFGGGGHPAAAGFSVAAQPIVVTPRPTLG